MAPNITPNGLIVERIAHHPGCSLDDLVTFCPELTWNQIFFELDRLSRAGLLRLILSEHGRYTLAMVTGGIQCLTAARCARASAGPDTIPTRCEVQALEGPHGVRG